MEDLLEAVDDREGLREREGGEREREGRERERERVKEPRNVSVTWGWLWYFQCSNETVFSLDSFLWQWTDGITSNVQTIID